MKRSYVNRNILPIQIPTMIGGETRTMVNMEPKIHERPSDIWVLTMLPSRLEYIDILKHPEEGIQHGPKPNVRRP